MSTSMLLGMFDWIADFFKALFDLIPKIVYLLYSSLACVLDVLQLFFRKLAGLDVYYVDGKAVTGDLVTNFITGILGINPEGFHYSALTTVFWSFVVFGIIVCFGSTIIAVIKSHYSYDDKAAKGPMQYVYTAGKAIINIVAVPVIVVLGLYVSQAILTALDTITSISSGNVVSMYGNDAVNEYLVSVDTVQSVTGNTKDKTYVYYDIFGFGASIAYGPDYKGDDLIIKKENFAVIGASNQTFSGSLFKTAAYNANRARLGQMNKDVGNFSGATNDEMKLFANASSNEQLADMIDTAFACNLHLNATYKVNYDFNGGIVSLKYFTNFLTQQYSSFSKFNVGLVWYYYDLWQFNFIVGFAGCIVCVTIFINIIMGLMTRLFMCIGLFLVAPPLFGLAPLDGGKAGKSWRENFMKQVLMAYGAVVGMNLMFLILPYINEIDFFNIAIADYFAQTLVIIVGLITIKAFIATLSGLIGGADANETGGKISEEVGQVAGKATNLTIGAAKAAGKTIKGVAMAPKTAINAGAAIGNKVQAISSGRAEKRAQKSLDNIEKYQRQRDALAGLNGRNAADVNKKDFLADYMRNGGSMKEAKELWKTVEQQRAAGGTLNGNDLKDAFGGRNEAFSQMENNYSSRHGGSGLNLARDVRTQTEARTRARTLKNYNNERYKLNSTAAKKGLGNLTSSVSQGLTSFYEGMAKDDKFLASFGDKSKLKEKPNWEKKSFQTAQKSFNQDKYANWLAEQQALGNTPTEEQMKAKKKELDL